MNQIADILVDEVIRCIEAGDDLEDLREAFGPETVALALEMLP